MEPAPTGPASLLPVEQSPPVEQWPPVEQPPVEQWPPVEQRSVEQSPPVEQLPPVGRSLVGRSLVGRSPVGRWSPEALGMPGVVRPTMLAPEPVLSRPGAEVDPLDPATIALAADLVATMRVAPGCVGLAANQIGESVRMFAVDVGAHPKTRACHGVFVLCNAEIVGASRWQRAREGCLSVPDLTGDVKRAGSLVVRGYLPGVGEPVTMTTDAFEARALQHEIDHCAGLLFLDRVAGPHAVFARKVYG